MTTETSTADTRTDGCRGGRPRDDAREQAILDAAIELVAEVGYDRMSMDAVAARAHASKATIYRRWPGKAELIADAVRRWAVDMETTPLDTGTLRGDLIALCGLMRRFMCGADGDVMFGLSRAARNDPELGRVLHEQLFATKHALGEGVVARAVARQELPAGTTAWCVHEVAPAVAIMRQLCGDELDDAFTSHLTDDILVPLLSAGPGRPQTLAATGPAGIG